MHRSFAYLSFANLIHNAKIIRKLTLNSKVIVAVKSNAYGHGIRSVSKILDEQYITIRSKINEQFETIESKNVKLIDGFGVSSLEEGLILKSINIKSEILLMQGVLSKEDLLVAINSNFSIVFHHFEQIKWLIELIVYDDANIKNLSIWLKINTGMNRLGFQISNETPIDNLNLKFKKTSNQNDNLINLLKQINNNVNDNAESAFQILNYILQCTQSNQSKITIMSHFASSDNKEAQSNWYQINNFLKFVENKNCYKSICNSGGIINFPNLHFDYVRSGIMLYGIDPMYRIEHNIDSAELNASTQDQALEQENLHTIEAKSQIQDLDSYIPQDQISINEPDITATEKLNNNSLLKSSNKLELKPVLIELGSYVISIQNVKKGGSIGYGAKYIAKNDMKIASIGIGYGDGYKFTINQGLVCIDGQNFSIVGAISMDIITIDITNAKNKIEIGHKAYLINAEKLNIVYVAKKLKTHVWHLLSNIQNRVKYIWI